MVQMRARNSWWAFRTVSFRQALVGEIPVLNFWEHWKLLSSPVLLWAPAKPLADSAWQRKPYRPNPGIRIVLDTLSSRLGHDAFCWALRARGWQSYLVTFTAPRKGTDRGQASRWGKEVGPSGKFSQFLYCVLFLFHKEFSSESVLSHYFYKNKLHQASQVFWNTLSAVYRHVSLPGSSSQLFTQAWMLLLVPGANTTQMCAM